MILKLPYSITLVLLQVLSKLLLQVEVWPRHSFITSSFEPFKSDLDISVYTTDIRKIKNFQRLYKAFKFLFPLLGEYVVFTPESINYLKSNELNPFEINRDPELIKRYLPSYKLGSFNYANAVSFLLRTLASDYHNVRKPNYKRLTKWKNHFSYVNLRLNQTGNKGFAFDPNNDILYSVADAVRNVYFNNMSDDDFALERYNLINYFEIVKIHRLPDVPKKLDEMFTYFICFFPEYVLHYNQETKKINDIRLGLMLHQIEWQLLVNIRNAYNLQNIELAISDTKMLLDFLNQLQTIRSQNSEIVKTLNKISSAQQLLVNLQNKFI